MTVLERFKAVKNKTLREKLLKNYDPEVCGSFCGPSNFAVDDHTALGNGFTWLFTTEGTSYWSDLYNHIGHEHTFDKARAKFKPKQDMYNRIKSLEAQVKQLKSAIRKTISQNRHLADGDNCTLIELKKVLKERPK
jgi:hypothetical protein